MKKMIIIAICLELSFSALATNIGQGQINQDSVQQQPPPNAQEMAEMNKTLGKRMNS